MRLAVLLFICLPFGAGAQVRWHNADSMFGPLPAGFHVYRTTDSLDGKPNIAWYAEADLKAKNLDFATQIGWGKRFTPTQYYQQENQPLLVVNGTFFEFATNRNLNLVVRNGQQLAYNIPVVRSRPDTTQFYYITRSAIGINKRREADVAWVFTDSVSK